MKPLAGQADLATRKLLLQQRSAVLRELLSVQLAQSIEPALTAADRVQAGGKWVKRHPAVVAAVVAALLVWRPAGVVKVAGKGWWLWQTWRRLQPVIWPVLQSILTRPADTKR
ncbi:MAG: YqjK family protein [Acidobacteriota bacterium]